MLWKVPTWTTRTLYTDQSVHYVIKPPSLINTYPRRSFTTLKIRELKKQDPADANLGNIKTVAEGTAFSEVKLGTDDVTRLLKAFGAFWAMPEEITRDSNLAHMVPYATVRLREEFMLKLESVIIDGSDESGAEVVGFSEEVGIQTPAALTAIAAGDGMTRTHINAFCDAIYDIMTNSEAYGTANTIILHPKDYAKLLKAWENNVGYLFAPPNSGSGGGPPVATTIPTLFGVPISLSQALAEKTMWVADTSDSYAAFNGGEYQTKTGLKEDDLTKRVETMVMKTYVTQFTRFPEEVR